MHAREAEELPGPATSSPDLLALIPEFSSRPVSFLGSAHSTTSAPFPASAKLVVLLIFTLGSLPGATGASAPPSPCTNECINSCFHSSDGHCDDGGAGAEYALCSVGSDCTDCGPRCLPLSPPPMPPARPRSECLCNPPGSICSYAYDGRCDDGGQGSEHSYCSYGSDCFDCGLRCDLPPPSPPASPPAPCVPTCLNTCGMTSGVCEDGGPGAEYYQCYLGLDCADCGPRCIPTPPPTPPTPPPQPPVAPCAPACTNTCRFSSDGDCDDGGSGSEFSSCAVA